jgi:multidrug efflux pump subunit AcrA (membrane-fusion protein)
MNAPTLYVIAADLTKMQVIANIDESDVGRMRPGQQVTFRVDAYPTDVFTGAVEQVRLQPTVVQNVVVYSTVIAVPNQELKLKPGMTANVNIEVARRNNVLRIPSAAVRFRPTEQMFQVLNQPVPPEVQRGAGRGSIAAGERGGRGGRDGGAGQAGAGEPAGGPATPPATAAPTPAPGQTAPRQSQRQPGQQSPPGGNSGRPESGEARGGGDSAAGRANEGAGRGFDPNMSPEERRKRMEERMASMSPEERERFQARMAERAAGGQGGQPGFGRRADGQQAAGAANQGGGRGGNQASARNMNRGISGNVTAGTSITSGAETIDSLFAPLQVAETRGRAWIYENKQLRSVPVRLGVSDGTYFELLEGDLKEGQEVVVNMVTGLEPVSRPGQQQGTGNPLMGPQRGPGGGRGGGGRGF